MRSKCDVNGCDLNDNKVKRSLKEFNDGINDIVKKKIM